MLVQFGAVIGKTGAMEISGSWWYGNSLELALLLKTETKFPIAIKLADFFTSKFEQQWIQMKPSGNKITSNDYHCEIKFKQGLRIVR